MITKISQMKLPEETKTKLLENYENIYPAWRDMISKRGPIMELSSAERLSFKENLPKEKHGYAIFRRNLTEKEIQILSEALDLGKLPWSIETKDWTLWEQYMVTGSLGKVAFDNRVSKYYVMRHIEMFSEQMSVILNTLTHYYEQHGLDSMASYIFPPFIMVRVMTHFHAIPTIREMIHQFEYVLLITPDQWVNQLSFTIRNYIKLLPPNERRDKYIELRDGRVIIEGASKIKYRL